MIDLHSRSNPVQQIIAIYQNLSDPSSLAIPNVSIVAPLLNKSYILYSVYLVYMVFSYILRENGGYLLVSRLTDLVRHLSPAKHTIPHTAHLQGSQQRVTEYVSIMRTRPVIPLSMSGIYHTYILSAIASTRV